MAQFICRECGIEADETERTRVDHEVMCEGNERGHDWSDDDPISRAVARMKSSVVDTHVVDSEENASWWWIEVVVDDPDVVGGSEVVADAAQAEGFEFIGVGKGDKADGTPSMRFNKPRDE